MPSHPSESPAKKQSKWSQEEDAIIIDLRGSGMKWEDISKRLPGRSAISCRLHYQNYLERRSEWDDERKNKLARLYERFKPEMWAKVAEELAVPWRAAEAMHWQLGESDMARRAGVVPFTLNPDPSAPGARPPPNAPGPRGPGHVHSHSHGSPASYAGPPPPGYGSPHAQHQHLQPMQQQQQQQRNIHTRSAASGGPARSIAARRDSTSRSVPPSAPGESLTLAGIQSPMMGMGGRGGGGSGGGGNGNGNGNGQGHGHGHGHGRGGQMLPGVLEMTTRVSPYSMPAYSISSSMGGSYPSPGPVLPAMGYREGGGGGSGRGLPSVPEGPRSGSEEPGGGGAREGLRRRQHGGYE